MSDVLIELEHQEYCPCSKCEEVNIEFFKRKYGENLENFEETNK